MARRLSLQEAVASIQNWISENSDSESDSSYSDSSDSDSLLEEIDADRENNCVDDNNWKPCNRTFRTNNFYEFNPRRKPGSCAPEISDNCKAIECLRSLLSDEILTYLVDMINEYGAMKVQMNTPARKRSLYHNWKDITTGELLKLLAVLIAMGMDKRTCIRDYWSTSIVNDTPLYAKMFSRERFEAIYHTMLHASEVNSQNKDKIEAFSSQLLRKFQTAFYPSQKVAIDEMVLGFKGRFKYKQYNPMKPHKHHIKTYGLCDSATGYVYNLVIYFGSQTSYLDSGLNRGHAVTIFHTLLEPLDPGHHIFADRYYTSYQLLKYLMEKSYYYTGTLQMNRVGFPVALKTLRLQHRESKFFQCQNEDGNILCLAWRDKKAKKPCLLVTTSGANDMVEVQRKREVVEMPAVVNEYNTCMNGCDLADQMVGYYSQFERKTYKWWKRVFFWLLEITQVNSYILYCSSRTLPQKKISLKKYKTLLIEEIIQLVMNQHPDDILTPRPIGRPRTSDPIERYTVKQHLVQYTKDDRNCVVCSTPANRKRTNFICGDCVDHPHLHPKDCFRKYHTK